MKKLCAVLLAVTALAFAGCDLNEDAARQAFCSYYPEVCQYIDFDE